jgi:hypothetical protein
MIVKADRIEEEAAQETAARVNGPKRWLVAAGGAIALLLFGAVYLLRLDQAVGMYVDDAWYVLLGKALASGQGYTIINSPSPGILPLYPPAFSWLLSLVFRIAPEFPQNLWLLKSVSIAAMLGTGIVAYLYFARVRALPHSLAFGIAVATVLNPALVFVATSTVMSECVFTLVQLLTIAVIEWGVQRVSKEKAWQYAVPAAALASFAFLTRSIAVGLIFAVLVYLLKERLMRAAAIFVAGVILFVGPWMAYTRLHAPTEEQRREQNGHIVKPYTEQFWQNRAGQNSGGKILISTLPSRFWDNGLEILKLDAGAMIAAPFYRPSTQSGWEFLGISGNTSAFLLIVSGLVLIGFGSTMRQKLMLSEIVLPVSILIAIAWPWRTFRFILPLLPWVIFYLLMGLKAIYGWQEQWRSRQEQPRAPWIALATVVWSISLLNLYDHAEYIRAKRQPSSAERPVWLRAFEENEVMLKWMREKLPADRVIATSNPPLVHLFTGLRTIGGDDPQGNWENWKRLGVRYMAYASVTPVPNPSLSEWRYEMIYQSRGELGLRVMDLGPKETRPPWGTLASSGPIKVERFQ